MFACMYVCMHVYLTRTVNGGRQAQLTHSPRNQVLRRGVGVFEWVGRGDA